MADTISNRYVLVRHIGEGGMADVYLAIDSILKREVAIKILRGELNEDPVNLARFQKEALAISNTSHPNIVEIYDVGEDHGRNYIVMEYVRGKTLKQMIKTRGILPTDEAVNIMKQLVSATAHAHKVGIIHRDIKSQNVLVKDDGTVKLSDFGIAYTADAAGLTQTKTVMGSVHYLAPELAKGETCTPQSDIYSLGIVFYELLTGDVPYHGDTAVEIAIKHLHNDVPYVKDFNPEIPQSVENIIIKSTARNKDLRYRSAMEMYNDLVTSLDLSRNNEKRLMLDKEKNIIEKKIVAEEKKEEVKTKTTPTKKRVSKDKEHAAKHDVLGTMVIVVSVILALVVGLVGYNLFKNGSSVKEDMVKVPNVINYSLTDARSILDALELKIDAINYETTEDVPKGTVIAINPGVDNEVKKDSYVTLTVSLGTMFTVDNYVGMSIDEVKASLEAQGFIVNITLIEDKDKDAGTILFQDVAEGTEFAPTDHRIINFNVATYVTFMIPESIKGQPVEEAKKTLESLGAVVKTVQKDIESNLDESGNYINELGVVVDCNPAWNTYYTQSPELVITLYYY